MYYGGSQQRPDAPYSRPIRNSDGKVIAHVGEGNRKDVRNAVEAAHRASPGLVISLQIVVMLRRVELLMKLRLRAAGCHLSYGITQCYLPPDTSEHTPP